MINRKKSIFYLNNNSLLRLEFYSKADFTFGSNLNIILIIKSYKFSIILNSFSISLMNDWKHILWHKIVDYIFNDKLMEYFKIDIDFKNKGIIF
jgi:hypothetical protein